MFSGFSKYTYTGGPDVQIEEALEGREKHDGHDDDLTLGDVNGSKCECPRDIGLPVGTIEQCRGTQTLNTGLLVRCSIFL